MFRVLRPVDRLVSKWNVFSLQDLMIDDQKTIFIAFCTFSSIPHLVFRSAAVPIGRQTDEQAFAFRTTYLCGTHAVITCATHTRANRTIGVYE